MVPSRSGAASLLAAALLLGAVQACAPFEQAVGDVVAPAARGALLSGEVRSVDARRGRLEVQEERGRSRIVRFDERTRVSYAQRQYPASTLERGDVVRVYTTQDRSGTIWADRVDVRQTALDRKLASGSVQRIDGTVTAVDGRRGVFTLEQNRARPVTIRVTSRTRREDVRRVERLRRGERVRAEVRGIRGGIELVRFR